MLLAVRLNMMVSTSGWQVLCFNVTLFSIVGGRTSDHNPVVLSVIPSAQKGTVCLHHTGLLSIAVLLFHTLFMDYKKRDVFHISPSLFNPKFVLGWLD